MTADDCPLPPGCAAKYRVTRLLGSGGFGVVYEAVQLALNRRVVIKLPNEGALADPEQLGRFRNEARVTSKLRHPNIVVLVDFATGDGRPWIVYEFVEGRDLRAALATGPLRAEVAARAVAEVCFALESAHAAGILHRDIKPENVLMTSTGVCKVADFGLAKWSGATSVWTRAGMLLGTPGYLSPEQILGQPATPASDLYAAGVLLYELLAGHLPFDADTPLALLDKHLTKTPVSLRAIRPETPGNLEAIGLRLLAKDPAARFANAAEARLALESWSDLAGFGASPTRRFGAIDAPVAAVTNRTVAPRVQPDLATVATPRRSWAVLAAVTALIGGGAALLAPEAADRDIALPVAPPSSSKVATAPSTATPRTVPPPASTPDPGELVERLRAAVRSHPRDWPKWLELARACESAGDWGQGAEKYAHVLSQANLTDPRDLFGANLGLGRCLVRTGAWAAAGPPLRRAMALDPKSIPARRFLAPSLASAAPGRPEALRLAREVLALHPDDLELHAWLARWLVEDWKLEEAIPHLEKAATRAPPDYWSRRSLGMAYKARSLILRAMPLLQEAAARNPADHEVLHALGDCFLWTSRPEQARGCFQRALALDAASPALSGHAQALADLGRFDEAEPALRRALERDPADTAVRMKLVTILDRKRKPIDAERELEAGAAAIPGDTWPNIELARRKSDRGEFDAAAAHCEAVLRKQPHLLLALAFLADLRGRQGRKADSMALNRMLLEHHPDAWERNRVLADQLMETGQAAEATVVLRRVLKQHPGTPWARIRLATLVAREGHPEEAATLLAGLRGDDAFLGTARRALSEAYAASGDLAHSREQLEIILADTPKAAWALAAVAKSLAAAGRTTEALHKFAQFVASAPDQVRDLEEAGDLAMRHGNPVLAEAALRRALVLHPTSANAHVQLARLLLQQGKLDDASAHLGIAATLPGWRAEASDLRADVHLARRDRASAIRELRVAAAAEPASSYARTRLAIQLREAGDRAGAEAAYRQALERAEPPSHAFTQLAELFEADRRYSDAEAVLRRLVQAKDSSANRLVLAELLQRSGRSREAVAEYRTVLVRDPGNADAHRLAAESLRSTGDTTAALGEIRTQVRLHPRDAPAERLEAELLAQLNELSEAEAACKRSLAIEAGSAATFVVLGDIVRRRGRADEARTHFEKAVELEPTAAWAWLALGQAWATDRRLDEAERCFREAVRVDGSNALSYSVFGGLLLERGRLDEARRAFEAAVRLEPANHEYRQALAAMPQGATATAPSMAAPTSGRR